MQQTLSTWFFHARQFAGRTRRLLVKVPRPPGGAVRLHLGCGPIDHPGFINIDGVSRPHVHHIQSVVDLSNFASGSVDFIYTSHVLEHFPHGFTSGVLKEWHRVIKPGGALCISVPDFDKIVDIYKAADGDMNAIVQPLFGGQDYPFNFHYTAFNARSLAEQLRAAGFASVREWQHGSDAFHNLPDWSGRSIRVGERTYPISLNLEASK